jgi:hypothetical protein
MSPTLDDALHELAGDVGNLGDIERALRDVRNRRIRMAAGAVAATSLAAVLAVLAIPSPASIEPVGPKPTPTPTPAVEVLRPFADPMLSISEAPLADGADVAVVADGRAVVWAAGSPRLVDTTVEGWLLLSPDGRYLLVTGVVADSAPRREAAEAKNNVGGDVVVTDLTTGRELLRWQMMVDGEAAIPLRYLWSGDSRRLFLVLSPESEFVSEQLPFGHLRVWQRQGDALVPVGQHQDLPGTLIGVDETGQEALVADEQGDASTLSFLSVDRQTLAPAPWVAGYPRGPEGWALGQQCWDPLAQRVCWIDESGPGATHQVGVLDIPAEGGQSWATTVKGFPRFAGWRGGDPVVLLQGVKGPDGGYTDSGTLQVVRLAKDGTQVLRQFDASEIPKDGLILYRISVPAYR